IDSRAHQRSDSVSAGSELQFSGKTSLVVAGKRSEVRFDENERFLGADLSSALNRTTNSEQLQLRYRLTSLTTFAAGVEAVQDRFTNGGLRNANSIKVLPGFEMKPSALVSGSVFVGYRRFEPLNAVVPAYQGLIAAVDAKY